MEGNIYIYIYIYIYKFSRCEHGFLFARFLQSSLQLEANVTSILQEKNGLTYSSGNFVPTVVPSRFLFQLRFTYNFL